MSKIIFFEVDGTLVNFSCQMPDSTRTALKLLHENGHKLVVSTGRSKSEVYPWLLSMDWDGLICGAGAYVEWNKKEIYARYMSDRMVEIIVEYIESRGGTYILEGSSAIWERDILVDKNRALIEEWIKASNGNGVDAPIPKARLFSHISEASHIHKLNFHGMDMDSAVMEKELNRLLSGEGLGKVKAIRFNNGNVFVTSGEITMEGIHKSFGIDMLLKTSGFDVSESIAFGDSLNDYEMIKNAGIGIAMGNACDALKDAAHIVTSHIDENGIFNAAVRLGLIKQEEI